jgi:hypothetical protein
MTYIFFSDNKWFLHEGDLPVKPERLTYFGPESLAIIFYEQELKHYNQSIADIKAKALEIANPELFVLETYRRMGRLSFRKKLKKESFTSGQQK